MQAVSNALSWEYAALGSPAALTSAVVAVIALIAALISYAVGGSRVRVWAGIVLTDTAGIGHLYLEAYNTGRASTSIGRIEMQTGVYRNPKYRTFEKILKLSGPPLPRELSRATGAQLWDGAVTLPHGTDDVRLKFQIGKRWKTIKLKEPIATEVLRKKLILAPEEIWETNTEEAKRAERILRIFEQNE